MTQYTLDELDTLLGVISATALPSEHAEKIRRLIGQPIEEIQQGLKQAVAAASNDPLALVPSTVLLGLAQRTANKLHQQHRSTAL